MSEIELKLQDYPNTRLVGLRVRTCNTDEMKDGCGKLAGLWESFYRSVLPKVAEGTACYGVYTNYESDHTGYFDVGAAVAAENLSSPGQECVSSEIQAGKYLRFSPKSPGDDPVKEVIGLWQQVWAHFGSEACEHQRAYTSDFELYGPEKTVELFIAVK